MARTFDSPRHKALRDFLVEKRKEAGLRQVDLAKRLKRSASGDRTANTFLEFLGTRNGQSLVVSFSKIPDVTLRRTVVDLIERLAAIGKSDPPKPRRARPKRK